MAKKPLTWEDYEHGIFSPRQGSVGSATSRVQFDDSLAPSETDHLLVAPHSDDSEGDLRRRRYLLSRFPMLSIRAVLVPYRCDGQESEL